MRQRRPRHQRPIPPDITRAKFVERFVAAMPYSKEYTVGIVEPIAERVYDAVYATIDGAVMPPTASWMEDIIKKLESQ